MYNARIKMASSFDDYDSLGEFSIQVGNTDDESELGSTLGGVSMVGRDVVSSRVVANATSTRGAHHEMQNFGEEISEIQQIKSSEEGIYEDDQNSSYDTTMPGGDCQSFVNSELGVSAGDVSAILFGGRSAAYNVNGNNLNNGGSNYVADLFANGDLNTSHDDTVDLFRRDDDDTVVERDPMLDNHVDYLPIKSKKKKLGPLGDELSYAQDDSTIAPYEEKCGDLQKLDLNIHIDDEEDEEEAPVGILPVWLSSTNSRMKSVLVVSAALIVGSLVMAVVTIGASKWWDSTHSAPDAGRLSSITKEEAREIDVLNSTVAPSGSVGPSLRPSKKPTRKPTRKPTKAPVKTMMPVSEETGESVVAVTTNEAPATTTEATEAVTTTETTTTTDATSTTQATTTTDATSTSTEAATSTVKTTTASTLTDAPSATITSSTPTATSTTVSSTLAPAESPTVTPSFDPTSLPTTSPSNKPVTLSPSLSPTLNPSDLPSMQPVTETPSNLPTESPVTESPTMTPTYDPSSEPSMQPTTLSPTNSPSSSPSNLPTVSPSTPPSRSPITKSPSVSPTISPSLTPSKSPSYNPTLNPTPKPTASMAPSLSLGSEATVGGDATFYLMAEGGTNVAYWTERLGNLKVDKNGAKFLVHLGSAARKVDDCQEDAYANTAKSLKATPVPAYAVPGNHDWPACTNSTQGLNLWKKHFTNLNTKDWPKPEEYTVRRQTPSHPENFAFLWKRIMFIGLHMVESGDVDETASRIQDNLNWVNENVDKHFQDVDVIFMMGNLKLTTSENIQFFNEIATKKQNEWKEKYVVYARRASETGVTIDVGGLEKFDELRVGAEWPILDVKIKTNKGGKGQGGLGAKIMYREVLDGSADDKKKGKDPK